MITITSPACNLPSRRHSRLYGRLAYETLELAEADDQRMVVYLPADEASSAALDRLAERRPGALRAVGDPA